MKKMLIHCLSLFFVAGSCLAVSDSGEPRSTETRSDRPTRAEHWAGRTHDGVLELEWDDLLPENFSMEALFKGTDTSTLSDDDPKAKALLAKIRKLWREAPVVSELNGKTVKIPGFAVPLEGDGKQMREFLLVPYYGACIHVPPPPSNQIVYVKSGKAETGAPNMFDAIWVTGKLKVIRKESNLATAGYSLEASDITEYKQ